MTENENEEQSAVDEQRKSNVNSDYYDEVDEGAYEQSRKNVSEPDPRSRDLWQSANVSTDDSGPRVEEVAPVFAQARADALANPAAADGGLDEGARAAAADSAAEAQAEADRIREAGGFVAQTGPDAGIYDDPKLEDQVPSENFSAKPEVDEEAGERDADEVAADEKLETAGASNPSTDETDQRSPEQVEARKGRRAGTKKTDETQADLVSDTAGEQGGLDATSAPGAEPKSE